MDTTKRFIEINEVVDGQIFYFHVIRELQTS